MIFPVISFSVKSLQPFSICDLLKSILLYILYVEWLPQISKKHTHSDFDDFTVETVQHNYDITGICRGISSIMPKKKVNFEREIDDWNMDKGSTVR